LTVYVERGYIGREPCGSNTASNTFKEDHGLDGEWIFQSCDTNSYGGRLSYNAADRKLRKLCKRIGTKTKSPHKCRKTFATILMDPANGVPHKVVQRILGHKDISTTMKYYEFCTKTKEERDRLVINALSLAGRAPYQNVPTPETKNPVNTGLSASG